jgi:serine/threonine protein kinase
MGRLTDARCYLPAALPCLQGLVTEVITLTNLNHPHIIKVIGHCWAPQICMVLEYMPKGTLHDMLTYKALQLSWESPLLDVAQQMASAVAYLHSMRPPIVHRDIKTRNILMRDFRTCKLADFGLSVLSKADSRAGTVRYVAPEVAAYGESTVRSDVWSLGVCFWEMATRARFPGLRAAQRLPRRLPYSIPVAMRAVAFGCLSHDPATRLSAHDTEACLEEILRRIASLEYIPNEAPAAPAVAAAAAATDDDASSLAPYYQLDHSRLVVADLSQSQEVSQWYQDRLWNGEQLPAPPAPAPPPAVVASTLGRLMALDNHAREAERRASVPGIISPRFRGLQPHAAAATTVGGFAKLEAVPESPLNEAAESLSAPRPPRPPPPPPHPVLLHRALLLCRLRLDRCRRRHLPPLAQHGLACRTRRQGRAPATQQHASAPRGRRRHVPRGDQTRHGPISPCCRRCCGCFHRRRCGSCIHCQVGAAAEAGGRRRAVQGPAACPCARRLAADCARAAGPTAAAGGGRRAVPRRAAAQACERGPNEP